MRCFSTIVITIGILLIAATSCLESRKQSPATPVVEPVPQKPVSLPSAADLPTHNGYCILCHMDFDEDPIATDHLSKGITCAHCHGKSVDHMHDETMMTSPDVLWGRTEVEALCKHCHGPHKDPKAEEAFRKKWAGKTRENGRAITSQSICTDCHGLHTVARR